MDDILFSTDELLRRLESAADAFAVACLEGHVSSGNAAGIRLEQFGPVTAAATVDRPELDFMNRIHGLSFARPAPIDDVLSFYRTLDVRPWIELPPGADEVAAALADAGARPVESLAVLFGRARELPPPPHVEVRRIGDEDQHRFADVLLEGYGVGAEARAVDVPGVAASGLRDDFECYMARLDSRDAAAAVLTLHNGVGYLATASTLPAFRRRGCQTALVTQRIADAAACGCDVVASLTRFGSASQRTLERAGLRVAYTRTVWRLGPA